MKMNMESKIKEIDFERIFELSNQNINRIKLLIDIILNHDELQIERNRNGVRLGLLSSGFKTVEWILIPFKTIESAGFNKEEVGDLIRKINRYCITSFIEILNDSLEESFEHNRKLGFNEEVNDKPYGKNLVLKLEDSTPLKNLRNLLEVSRYQYTDADKSFPINEDILLKSLGIRIKGDEITKDNKKEKINKTDNSLIYFLYYKSLNNPEECTNINDLSGSKGVDKSTAYVSNRITEINKIIKRIVSKEQNLKIPKFITKEKGRGYRLNPRILT